MAGAVGNYSDGETIHGGDLNADITSLLGNDAQLFLDLFAGWNILVSGFALTAGAGMAVNVAAGLAYAGGVRLNMAAGSVTLAAANTQPRYDVIWVQAGKAAGTNAGTGNPTQADAGSYGVATGTPAGSPTVPALGDPTKVQVGTVYVPANAASAAACTRNSQATAPNAQGPVKTLIDLLTHIAASLATTIVHGFQATTAGGAGANQLAQTDANGNVGGAAALWDGTARRSLHPFADGSHVAGEIPQYNINGRVEDSERLQGLQTGTGVGQIPVLDGNGAVAKAEQLVTAGQSCYVDEGETAFVSVPNANNPYYFSITFNRVFSSPPRVIPSIEAQGSLPVQYGMQLTVYDRTTTGCTIELGQTTGGAQTLAVSWVAIGS